MKSMQKVSRGSGFGGVVRYAMAGGELIGGNMVGLKATEIAKEFSVANRLRPDVKKPVWHQALRLPKGEKVSKEKWLEIAADYMKRMGFSELHPHSIFLHDDPDGQHIHIVASRVALDSSLWHGQNENLISTQVCHKLEKMYDLQITKMPDKDVKKDRKSLTAGEINMAVRTEMMPPRTLCQNAVDEVLRVKCVITAPQFIERLAAMGVRAVPNIASTGTLNGFSFEAEGVSFTGSKLGESFKWAQLQKRGVEYVKTRDFESLADTRRRAGERAAAGPNAGADSGAPGPDRTPGAGSGAAAEFGSGAGDRGDEGTGPGASNVGASESSSDSIRPSELGATPDAGSVEPGADKPSGIGNGDQGGEHGSNFAGAGQPGAELENDHGQHAGQQPAPTGAASGAGQRSQGCSAADAGQQPGTGQAGREGAPGRVADVGPDAGGGGAGGPAGGGWASRFKQASAAKRRDPAAGRPAQSAGAQIDPQRARVAESNIVEARQIDPTDYLEALGFQVIKEGRHLSVRLHGDEAYRVTRKDDGHWVTCDKFENGIGDNIALVAELEPGTGFAEAVYRLSGAPSVAATATRPRPAPPPVVRKPPRMPAQSAADVRRGRAYLTGRGISLETIGHAETAGMLRYSARGVLFVGWDDAGTAQNITRRATDASELVQKRDLAGADKRHPPMLRGAADTVLIVEGGTDALAAHDIARRVGRPAPTVLVSGGANVRSWIETPWVQKILSVAKKITVCFEREDSAEKQAKTDLAHEKQIQRLQEVCSAQVTAWMPPEGIKDMADLNLHQLQEIEREAAQRTEQAPQTALEWQDTEASYLMPVQG